MKVAVIGIGAIGGLVAAYLKAKGVDVATVGRPEQQVAIDREGLLIEGARGKSLVFLDIKPRLTQKVDLAIIATKTQDIRDAVDASREYLRQAPLILSTQNGVRADKLLGMTLGEEKVISSIVMFGATYVPHRKIVHNFEGQWLIGRPSGANDDKVKEVAAFLKAAFETVEVENISAMKWTKIFVNMSNALPALLGKSMQETYADPRMCALALKILKEGFDAVDKLGIPLASMPDFDVEKLKGLAHMPLEQAAPIYGGIMTNLSKEPLYGSILQSLQRGRLTEIDFINGEIANQARLHEASARLNACVTEMVHRIEKTKKFLTPEQVLEQTEKAEQLNPKDFV